MTEASETTAVTHTRGVRDVVRERLASAGPTVRGRVEDRMVEEKIDAWSKKIYAAFTELDNLQKEIRKIESKPDHVHKNLDGSEALKTWNPDSIKRLDETKQRRAKLDRAINKALETNDYSELDKLTGGKGKDSKPSDDDDPA